jgi:hypothetical protein
VARSHRHGFTLFEIPIHHQLRSAGVTQVYKWSKMPEIFFRHVAALFTIWNQTKHTKALPAHTGSQAGSVTTRHV